MIPFLMYVFLKKYYCKLKARNSFRIFFKVVSLGLLITLLLLIPVFSISQNAVLKYKIVEDGDVIGWLSLEKKIAGNTSQLVMNSEVNTRMIFAIKVSVKESASFENGKLLSSSLYRSTNGHIKMDKQTKLNGSAYEVFENNAKENLEFSFIGANLLCLYFKEPVGIKQVYSDTHEDFRPVAVTDDGGYKVKFPDGSSNCYYYQGGICTKIKVKHTFYSVEIILIP